MRSLKNKIPVRIKIGYFKVINKLQRILAQSIRLLPGIRLFLILPVGRIKSIKLWIWNQRTMTSWEIRMNKPDYTILFPSVITVPIPPKCLNLKNELPIPSNYKVKKHYNYWEKESGHDSTKGFYRKKIQPFDESFLAYLPNSFVLGPSGAVLSSDLELFEESIWTWNGWLNGDKSQICFNLPNPQIISDIGYVIANNQYEGYPHWLLESLPRLYGLETLKKSTENLKPTLVFRDELNDWQIDSLKLLGVENYPKLYLKDKFLSFEHLFFPSYVGMPGTPHPNGCIWVRDTILKNIKCDGIPRRIYITRQFASRRRIINEDQLLPILKNYGFEIIAAEKLSFFDQVKLFAEAEAVVTIHGAGLGNLLFVPKECKVLEILERTHVNDHYYNLASILELDYYYEICDPIIPIGEKLPQGYADVEINLNLFESTLKVMFSK